MAQDRPSIRARAASGSGAAALTTATPARRPKTASRAGPKRAPKERGLYRIGLYPGTFDPITRGHIDIIGRAAKLVDQLVIGVAVNAEKQPLFSLEERVDMVRREANRFSDVVDISVKPFDMLLMRFAMELGATVIVRGLRAVSDFEYEFQMVAMNQRLNSEIETVFLMADPRHQAIASRLVKEIARLGGDVGDFVSSHVQGRLKERFGAV